MTAMHFSARREAERAQVLNSWKEIAEYVGRGVRTVQRWEQDLGFPVRRPHGRSRSSVLALTSDIDEWLRKAPLGALNGSEPTAPRKIPSMRIPLQDHAVAHAERRARLTKLAELTKQRTLAVNARANDLALEIQRAIKSMEERRARRATPPAL